MDLFAAIAERKIAEAMERGAFDDLALKGQALPADDAAGVPEELRMGYRILKNAGVLPPELQLHRDLLTLRELLDACRDETEREEVKKRLTEKQLRYDLLMERNFRKPVYRLYEARVMEKLGL